MRLVNALNACNVIAPKKDVRYYFNGVVLYLDSLTKKLAAMAATDGHRLLLITVDKLAQLRNCETVILSKNDIKLINLKYPLLDVNGLDGVTVEQLQAIVAECELIEGSYPDILRVLPAENRKANFQHIGVNAEYLADIFAVYKAVIKGVRNKQYPCFKLNFATAMDFIVASQEFDGIEVKYVLMPTRI